MAQKIRIDQKLVIAGLAQSRTEAQQKITAGLVFVHGIPVTKPASLVDNNAYIECKNPAEKTWVSRGGKKLEHAIKTFNVSINGMVAIDVGASTGGFTDVLLYNGARRVYAVDVGYGQLEHKLRTDNRVVVLDKTNARNLNNDIIPELVDVIVCDASFISLNKVLSAAILLTKPTATLMCLIKPQFEAMRHDIGKNGVVVNTIVHLDICNTVITWLRHNNWRYGGIVASPIKGPEGNQEYILLAHYDNRNMES